jgi:hypothetical protein
MDCFSIFLGSWFRASYLNMYKYKCIQRDATVLAFISRIQLYMFRAFTMPIIRSNITAQAAIGITYECGFVKFSVR